MRAVRSLWREERRARWFFAAHLQGALGAGAGYIALILLAYERIGSAWAATVILLGRGVRLWDGLEGLEKDYEIEATSSPRGVTHVTFTRAGV